MVKKKGDLHDYIETLKSSNRTNIRVLVETQWKRIVIKVSKVIQKFHIVEK